MAKRPDLEIELVASNEGRFEVSFNGELVFSKLETYRFPKQGEIAGLLFK